MNRSLIVFSIVIIAVSNAATTNSHADVVFFSPDSVLASNTNHPPPVAAENLIDRSGIGSGAITLANVTDTFHADGAPTDVWRGSTSAMPISLIFDFNSANLIEYVAMWQGVGNQEVVADFNLTFFDGVSGGGTQIGTTFFGSMAIGTAGNVPLNGQLFDVPDSAGVRSIEMQITSVGHAIGPHVHFGEFMVGNTVSAIPEPSSILVWGAFASVLFIQRVRPE